MRPESFPLEVPTVLGGVGKIEVVDRFFAKTVQASGFVDGEWQLEGTLNGTNWAEVESPISADGFTYLEPTIKHLRLKCTVAPSGAAPSFTFGGLDTRSF